MSAEIRGREQNSSCKPLNKKLAVFCASFSGLKMLNVNSFNPYPYKPGAVLPYFKDEKTEPQRGRI